ncbi:M36 family metallopeptidase [Nocardioides sp. MAHUQ-72]|uniref:M36 family metallopeptidase n=1 Tax=unclassified Nocardioides TaxID=2615069 RepID=UPI00360781E6
MTTRPVRRGRLAATVAVALTATLVTGPAQLPAHAAGPAPAAGTPTPVTPGDPLPGPADQDLRGTALPTLAQRAAVSELDVVDVRWNQFGTPSSLLPADGSLGAATSDDPVEAARSWLAAHADVFGLTASDLGGLDLVNDQRLAQSDAHAVLFRQRFGELTPALDSMVTVGVADGRIAYVSSSLTRTTGTPAAATLSPLEAWRAAAEAVDLPVDAGALDGVEPEVAGGWTRFSVPGLAQEQQVRLRALAMADGSVRPVFETNVLDVAQGSAVAWTAMVDARDGSVLHLQDRVDNENDVHPFPGETTATDCGPRHEFELGDDRTRRLDAVAVMANAADDVVVKLFDPQGELLASGDLATSPETASYTTDAIPAGKYAVQVCPFDDPTTPLLPPFNYAVTVTSSDVATPGADTALPAPLWRYFATNPTLDWSPDSTPGNSVVGCWTASDTCTAPTGPFGNIAAPGPWDTVVKTGQPTLTTVGNNANTHEAWLSPDSPGGTLQAPVSPTREYTQEFTDAWNNSGCDPTQLRPGGNDINQAVTNLFVAHNRMHDYSYYLGFTEANYNLQQDNMGRGGVAGDSETGNAQAGAIDGGAPSYLGRDNANQITLQDGTPGITNQYLFQPIAGAFYSPCTDGALDMSVVGHEYTHAISNRMIGGPDEGITSEQGGAMGESWGDLTAAEYMFSHGYSTGTSPWVVGPYATGNRKAGIRDYPINRNPLNYSDYGFDSTGVEVHADGEIWNGTQWQVRQALVRKWDAKYPYADKRLQLRCAQAGAGRTPLPPNQCPGNRRWIQLVFDAFLLQQGATSMLDARDAMLAADRMRFGGKDLTVMWDAFARRGMGRGASTPNADSGDPTPSFASPRARNATVTVKAPGRGKVYVGHYEARATPVADTSRRTKLDDTVRLVPGRHQLLFASAKRGFQRFTLTVRPGEHRTVRVPGPRNLAAGKAGAKVIRSSPGSLNPGALIDGTERTAWGGTSESNVDATHPYVAVDLTGRVHTVRRVNVSAMLNPAPASPTDVPLAADPDSGSRFTALRRFALEACVRHCRSTRATWKRFYTSGPAAFPAMRPRPVAPDLALRSFAVRPTRAAAIRFVALENQCTGFAGYAGEQDADPLNDTDCKSASDRGSIVHAAELQVY